MARAARMPLIMTGQQHNFSSKRMTLVGQKRQPAMARAARRPPIVSGQQHNPSRKIMTLVG